MSACISICGSMSFMNEMEYLAEILVKAGFKVLTPVREEQDVDWSNTGNADILALKREYIDRHLKKIRRSDAILVANFPKHGIKGYVGPNTLMEAAFAHALDLPTIFLNDPSQQACGLECSSISFGCAHGDSDELLRLLGKVLNKMSNVTKTHSESLSD